MGIYTIGVIAVILLLLIGLGLVMLFIMKLDKKIDRENRLGKDSVYKTKKNTGNNSEKVNN